MSAASVSAAASHATWPEHEITYQQMAVLFPKAATFSGLCDELFSMEDVAFSKKEAARLEGKKIPALDEEAMSVLYEVFSGLTEDHIGRIAKQVAYLRTKIWSEDYVSSDDE